MNYKNGRDILPPELLNELQKYIEGELVYIPKKEDKRAAWGENNGTRSIMQWRNKEIYSFYKQGASVVELAGRYHLSEDSIRKVISKFNKITDFPGSLEKAGSATGRLSAIRGT